MLFACIQRRRRPYTAFASLLELKMIPTSSWMDSMLMFIPPYNFVFFRVFERLLKYSFSVLHLMLKQKQKWGEKCECKCESIIFQSSLCCRHTTSQLAGQRVGLFSYGSGSAATLYSVRVTQDHTPGETLTHPVGVISTDRRLLLFLLLFKRRSKNHNDTRLFSLLLLLLLFPSSFMVLCLLQVPLSTSLCAASAT